MNTDLVLSPAEVQSRGFVSKVYMWMTAGLALTGWLAATIGSNGAMLAFFTNNRILFYGLMVGELGLVIWLTAGIHRMTVGAATLAFLFYAAFNGVTLSLIFLMYSFSTIGSAFFVTAGTFGIMSLYGYTTKKDLTSMGHLLFMALIGLVLGSVVNIFLRSQMITWITTYVGILIFVGLTAYDTQKLKRMAAGSMDEETAAKGAILGALTLYLDFINLFLMMLRVMGRRK